MNLLRKLLFPFAILYGFITSLRNYLYDKGIIKSYAFDIPVIAVGNLSVGGTGKTPQIEYLIRLLSPNYKIATLSRGYKRKSEGFVLADFKSDAQTLGDEPFQYHVKFPDIQVAVDADRKNGIEQLLSQSLRPDIILLDDAFQHRKVKAGFYILLTSYDDLFYNDYMLPTGNLRESRRGAKRADVIIVTKCPANITKEEQERINAQIGLDVPVFFSTISYEDKISNGSKSLLVEEIKPTSKILLAGIAKPKPFFDFLQSGTDEMMEFPDHHNFSQDELSAINKKANSKIIITTEKDFVRLRSNLLNQQIYFLPIKSLFLSGAQQFDESIRAFIESKLRR